MWPHKEPRHGHAAGGPMSYVRNMAANTGAGGGGADGDSSTSSELSSPALSRETSRTEDANAPFSGSARHVDGVSYPVRASGAANGVKNGSSSSNAGLNPAGTPNSSNSKLDWLSPPASPNPDTTPFFDESEAKRTHMADSKFYATHPAEEHKSLPHGQMPTLNSSFLSATTGGITSSGQNHAQSSLAQQLTAAAASVASASAPSATTGSTRATVSFAAPATKDAKSNKQRDEADHTTRSPTKSRNPTIARTASDLLPPSSSGKSSASRSPSRVAMPETVPNFKYRDSYSSQMNVPDRTNVNADEDEEIELGLHGPEDEEISAELRELYNSFQNCIDLREKYITVSCQRLEDNPINYDGEFAPRQGSTSTSASRPASPDAKRRSPVTSRPTSVKSPQTLHTPLPDDSPAPAPGWANGKLPEPWKIYPPPPKPHWEHRDPFTNNAASSSSAAAEPQKQQEFNMADCEIPGAHPFTFELDSQGVYQVYRDENLEKTPENVAYKVPNLKEYFMDLEYVLGVISDGPAKSFAYRRIKYLESRWNLYCLLNEYQELAEMKRVPHRDFYNVRKVDTHVHHSACMNQKHLLRFIKSKMKKSADDVVTFRDGRYLTLRQVFESLNLTAYDLSIDTLDMHAHRDAFHRFDRFNAKYNPIGESRLREIFLKTDNHVQGRYLAEVTKEVFDDLHTTKYQMAEYRISIYGRSRGEWDKLAKWVVGNGLFSDNVRWLIQIPRLYEVFKASGTVQSFGDVVQNIFQPLFEVTQDPSTHPELHVFLQRVIGFDSVDDESKTERRLYRKFPFPKDWNTKQNPPYNYWLFYLFANMATLNNWRRERGFNTLVLRPHAGEAGDTDHLTSAFLTSHSISHGILLRKVPALCYLYYLEQIGVAMSPLSNNALFLTYERNPFPQYFRLGLNISLSTDDPLQLHYTKEPLMEEYSVAAQIYKLSPADMCELARNSVIQSGFEMEIKRHWLGHDWYLPGAEGNLVDKTNVPNVRVAFRYNTLMEERTMIRRYSTRLDGAQTPVLQTVETRPDLFPASSKHDALSGKDGNVAALAMGDTHMPDLASLKVTK